MKKILIFPSDSEIAREIYSSLKDNKHFKCIGGSSMPNGKGSYLFEENYFLPYYNEPTFCDDLNDLIDKQKIDYIIPAHDDVCVCLSQNVDKIDALVVGQSYETNVICRSKSKTYSTLKNLVKCPKLYCNNDTREYPCFIKPDKGQGSKDCCIVSNEDDYFKNHWWKIEEEDFICCEYLPKYEYTVDCLSQNGKVLFAGTRKKVSSKNGISDISEPIVSLEIDNIANIISNKLVMNGAWFFQLKEDVNGELTLLEVGPRVSGGMSLYRMMGINFIEGHLWMIRGKNIIIPKLLPNCSFAKFFEPKFKYETFEYHNVYIDFDDTLYLNKSKINPKLCMFLIQCLNENKTLHILTRSDKQKVMEVTQYWGIDLWFWSVIKVPKDQTKGEYIKDNSVFIDDSFVERLSSQRENVYCFGLNNFEILINDTYIL